MPTDNPEDSGSGQGVRMGTRFTARTPISYDNANRLTTYTGQEGMLNHSYDTTDQLTGATGRGTRITATTS